MLTSTMSDDVEWVKKMLDDADVSRCLVLPLQSSLAIENASSSVKILNQALVDPFLEMEGPTAAADVKKVFTPLGAKATQFSEPNAGPFGYWPNLRKISD
jgi:hypothetical protein